MNANYEQLIQRMVDNELDESQRTEFLKLAESHPELWRETALAFVEDQIWSGAVTRQRRPVESPIPGAGTEKAAFPRRSVWWMQYGPQLMMTAASVMLVLSLALRFNPVPQLPGPAPDAAVARSAPETPPSASLGPGGQLVSQPLRLQVNDSFDVPIYEDEARFREELQRLSQLDPATLKRFQQAGYQVRPDIQYLQGNSQDGRSFIVPVQRLQIRRMGQ